MPMSTPDLMLRGERLQAPTILSLASLVTSTTFCQSLPIISGKRSDDTETQQPHEDDAHHYCCAGTAQAGSFSTVVPSTFANQVHTNYLGTVYTVHAFLPYMTEGTVVLVSSMAGQLGLFGYTQYAPTKFALRGFAEALHMELLVAKPRVHVQLVYPPDTETPGLEVENETKPVETKLLSGTVELLQPGDVAQHMVQQASDRQPNFHVYFGLEGWMLTMLTAGMSPESSLMAAVVQSSLMGFFRFISLFYLNDFLESIASTRRGTNTTEKSHAENRSNE